MAGEFENLNFEAPFVMQDGDVRSLHFTAGETQSSMRIDRPDELQVDYTRTMMGFLLLAPRPRHIAMVGLGGGSLVKFCHRFLPLARITVVENNPAVIALRGQFNIPDEDDRFRVVADDGARFIRGATGIDVLLVDGFDQHGQPPQLCSADFYDACFAALARGGVMVVNLHSDHPEHDLILARIAGRFHGNAMQVAARDKCNSVVFAGRGLPVTLQALRSVGWARILDASVQRQLRGEFAHIGWNATGLLPSP